jgi:hypothetical protein
MRQRQFDRLGVVASAPFDIYENGLQFVSAVTGIILHELGSARV